MTMSNGLYVTTLSSYNRGCGCYICFIIIIIIIGFVVVVT